MTAEIHDLASSTPININIGILGHVDSGKTSLVKSLSTLLSTAALDKNPQSRERGITLDLGFSSFSRPLPARLRDEATAHGYGEKCHLQFTLVDCPGHASLIRTIIGGAHIIDMMILVIDINKGIQAQTAECLVIGEITTDNLIVVLNKVDAISVEERTEKLEKMMKHIRKVFRSTKFKNPKIVATAAYVGGEKVASVGAAATSLTSNKSDRYETIGIDDLILQIEDIIRIPLRNTKGKFLYSIDHCFPIKGHGTVLTGTVVSGSVSVNNVIEIPHLQVTKKVKSIQMFRKPVKSAIQGDRIAICVTNLESASIERAIACHPDSVTCSLTILCMVKKIRFFKFPCVSGGKYHVSIGHETVVATVNFFGAKELYDVLSVKQDESIIWSTDTTLDNMEFKDEDVKYKSSCSIKFPSSDFDWNASFEKQDELIGGKEQAAFGEEPIQWAIVKFQIGVYCPSNCLIIGSRLDADVSEGSSVESSCRLAFYGPVKEVGLHEDSLSRVRLFKYKTKEATIVKITDSKDGVCREAIGWHLGGPENAYIEPYIGMKFKTEKGHVGILSSVFGSDGKFKVKFPMGAIVTNGTKFSLVYKKYSVDKSLSQDGMEFEHVPISSSHVAIETKSEKVSLTNIKNDSNSASLKKATNEIAKESVTVISSEVNRLDKVTQSHQVEPTIASSKSSLETRQGCIDSIKSTDDNPNEVTVIISGMFRIEENIKQFIGSRVITASGDEGRLIGPYAKMGKCKVSFPKTSFKSEAGSNATMFLSPVE